MSRGLRFTDEFNQDAVAQVVERGYAVSEVAERLGMPPVALALLRCHTQLPAPCASTVLPRVATAPKATLKDGS